MSTLMKITRAVLEMLLDDEGITDVTVPEDPTISDLQNIARMVGTTASEVLARAERVAAHRADVQADQEVEDLDDELEALLHPLQVLDWDEAGGEWVECRPDDEDGPQ